MQHRAGFLVIGSLLVAAVAMAGAAGALGTFVSESDGTVVLTLDEAADGSITGTLRDATFVLPVQAWRDGAGLTGAIATAAEPLPFTVEFAGEQLLMRVGPEGMVNVTSFRRVDDSMAPDVAATAGVPAGSAADAEGSAGTTGTVGRHVSINGEPLSDSDLAGIEQQFRLRIPDADYWYDPVLGAWGVRGSPTLGFIMPGLPLGGPLAADASGGGTAVFINGRALHPDDLNALQQLVGSAILPGRYFITSQGLAGMEGGPPLWNLADLVRRNGDNPTNTWQSSVTGASGFSDGHTGAVFLPDGGIVSYGD